MKKLFFFAAALAVLASCNMDQNGDSINSSRGDAGYAYNPINFANVLTRGYCTDATFFDTAIAELHAGTDGAPSDVKTARDMQISAYLTPQTGESGNYFVNETFSSDGETTPKWHHNPPIYWPIAGSLDFLAYSVKTAFPAEDVEWNASDASKKVQIQVLDNKLQDDIVFAAAQGTSDEGATAVAMEFKHAQAWLEFQLKVKTEDMEDKIAITGIDVEQVYTGGELTISREAAIASASWNFRKESKYNLLFPDNYNVYGTAGVAPDFEVDNPLTKDVQYLDALLPEQGKTSFVIRYVLSGQDKELAYRYDLSTGASNWTMGEKYIYAITFEINELTIAPTVKEYANGTVTDLTPTTII